MLRFFTALAGPIFAKEMIEVARRKRYYFNRFLYLLALLAAVTIVWQESNWQRSRMGTGSNQLQAMARVAQEIFVGICVVQFGAVFLLVPLFVAGLIAGERESNSLELLFTTALYDREIVLGKLASRLAMMTLLILCGLPVINLILLFGGVSPMAVIRVELATLLAMVYAGSVTMYFSTISKTPTTALIRSLWWMAVCWLGLPILSLMIVGLFRINERDPGAIIVWGHAFVNPIFLFAVAIEPSMHRQMANYLGAWFFPVAFVPILVICSLLLWRSVARLRMAPTLFWRISNRWRPLAWLVKLRQRQVNSRDYLRRARAERFVGSIAVRNPLWLRARWTPIYDRERHILRIQMLGWLAAGIFLFPLPWGETGWPPSGSEVTWPLALVLAGAMSWLALRAMHFSSAAWRLTYLLMAGGLVAPFMIHRTSAWSKDEVALIFLVPTWIAAFVLTAILGATSLVGDRRRGFLELVLISPLEPREILGGTVLAVMQHLTPVYLLATALTGWFWWFGAITAAAAAGSLFTGVLFGGVLLLLGVTCSLAAERAPAAVIPTVIFGAMLCIGLLFVAALFRDLTIPLLMVVASLGTVGCWIWARRSCSPAAVGCFYFCVHLGMLLAAALLNSERPLFVGGSRLIDQVFVMSSPLALIVTQIEDSGWSRHFSSGYLPCYWLALSVNMLLGWAWTIKNFDRLAGRAHAQTTHHARRAIPIITVAPSSGGARIVAAPLTSPEIIAEFPSETS